MSPVKSVTYVSSKKCNPCFRLHMNAGWERFFGIMRGFLMSECSGFVFKKRIKRERRNKNRVSKQNLFCFRFPLCPLFCFLTVHRRGQGEESRAPPLIRFPSLQKSSKGGKDRASNKNSITKSF